jgi:uncharacterized protein YjbJ (UPF0337 family)
MNKDQIKGSARETAGKIQKHVGKATANGSLAVKGSVKEVAGKVQKEFGNAKADAEARRKVDREEDEEV